MKGNKLALGVMIDLGRETLMMQGLVSVASTC